MATTSTDGWMTLQNGHMVTEDYPGGMPPDATHAATVPATTDTRARTSASW
jgi:hypothetical protein